MLLNVKLWRYEQLNVCPLERHLVRGCYCLPLIHPSAHKAPHKILPAMPPCRPRVGGLQTAAAAPLNPSAHKATHEILPAMPRTIAGLAAARPESPPCNASPAPLAAARGEGARCKKKSGSACARSRRVGSQPLAFPLARVLGAVSSPSLISTASLSAAHRLPYRPQKPPDSAQSNPTEHGWARLGYASAAAKPPLG